MTAALTHPWRSPMKITSAAVAARRRQIQHDIDIARRGVADEALMAHNPAVAEMMVAHAKLLAGLLLDVWQLDLVGLHLAHVAGECGPGCDGRVCLLDDSPEALAEMADRWQSPWPSLAAWVRDLAGAGR